MKPVLSMVGVSLLVWLVATALLGRGAIVETALGALGPLAAAVGSWLVIERTMRRDPTQVTPLMMKLFAGKMLFFGLYLVLAVVSAGMRPVPFMVSFTSAFVMLYLIEALYLQRLFADGLRASR
jgi:hypothetical protein